MLTYELFPIEGGFGFKILQDGNTIIYQEYSPDRDGFNIMTEEEATLMASIVLERVK